MYLLTPPPHPIRPPVMLGHSRLEGLCRRICPQMHTREEASLLLGYWRSALLKTLYLFLDYATNSASLCNKLLFIDCTSDHLNQRFNRL